MTTSEGTIIAEEGRDMKSILIDPNTKSVTSIDISKDARLNDYFGEKPRVAMKFPKGDVLFVGVQERAEAFIREDLGRSGDPV